MTEPAKAPGLGARISAAFSQIWEWPSRLSSAAKAAWLMAVFLILAALTVWAFFLTEPGHIAPRHAFTPFRIAAILVLMIAIPLVTYRLVQLWLEGDRSRFPEVDYAWNAGLEALERNGLRIDEIPLFLILGSPGDEFERRTAHAAGEFRVRGVPEGPAPLHWYAGPDRICLFVSEAGLLSQVSKLTSRRSSAVTQPPVSRPLSQPHIPVAPPAEEESPQVVSRRPTAPPLQAASPRGTMELSGYLAERDQPGRQATTQRSPSPYRGTLEFDAPPLPRESPRPVANVLRRTPPPPLPPAAAVEQPPLITSRDALQLSDRLEYLANKLRAARRPLCPVNGVLTLLPFAAIQSDAGAREELSKAIRADLNIVQNTLELRAPVTAMVFGMESEAGFQELVRRVGRDRAAVQRFGHRFDIRALPAPEELAALSAHVCGAFEDWIYTLFREDDALSRPGNAQLYSLLCRVRCHLKEPLAEVLSNGFGHNRELHLNQTPLLFSGCYVAATGESEDRQAFLRGVFDKLEAEQEEVEWTPSTLATEASYRRLSTAATMIDVALVISVLGMIAIAISE